MSCVKIIEEKQKRVCRGGMGFWRNGWRRRQRNEDMKRGQHGYIPLFSTVFVELLLTGANNWQFTNPFLFFFFFFFLLRWQSTE